MGGAGWGRENWAGRVGARDTAPTSEDFRDCGGRPPVCTPGAVNPSTLCLGPACWCWGSPSHPIFQSASQCVSAPLEAEGRGCRL